MKFPCCGTISSGSVGIGYWLLVISYQLLVIVYLSFAPGRVCPQGTTAAQFWPHTKHTPPMELSAIRAVLADTLIHILEYRTFIKPADKRCLTFSQADIPQAAVNVQRVHVMFYGCTHELAPEKPPPAKCTQADQAGPKEQHGGRFRDNS